jgi:signal transduction histidine kinase
MEVSGSGMRHFFASLRFRLLLLVFFAFGPMLGLVLYTYSDQMQQATLGAEEEALRLARLAASDQQRLIEGARQLLIALAQLPPVQNLDAGACNQFLAHLLKQYPLYENMGAVRPDGEVFCSAVPSTATANVAGRAWFVRALETGDFVAGDYVMAGISGKPALNTAYPAFDETGELRALVFAGIDLNWLDEFVSQAHLPAGSTLSVVDGTGTVLTRYPDPDRWRGTILPASAMQALLTEEQMVGEAKGLDGVPRLYGVTSLGHLPAGEIYVRVGIPLRVASAEARRMLTRNLIALAAVSLLVFGAAWIEAQLSLLRPLDRLLGVIERFEAGDSNARAGPPPGGGELGHLGRAFDQMATTVQARQIERDRSEEALRLHSARTEALATIAARLNAQLDLESVLRLVCQETAGALQTSAASVSLYDESEDALHLVSHYGLPEDFGRRIEALAWSTCTVQLRAGEAVVVPDVGAHPELPTAALFATLDIRSFVSTPMVHEGRLVGTLCIFARGQGRAFTEGELAFLRAIADQAAQAIANAHLYEALQQEQRARAALLEKTISAQEDERKRIARELHDQTSQDLAALMLSLDTCALSLETEGPGAEQHLQTAKSIAETMLANVHRLINDLRPSLLDDLGLAPAILWYGEQRLKPVGIALDFRCDRMEARLRPALETALFRITQEALTNVVRHAHATRVEVTLDVNGHAVHLTVEDNGSGFEVAAAGAGRGDGRGLGLRGIRERATTMGGDVQIRSAPGEGTTIEVEIPL